MNTSSSFTQERFPVLSLFALSWFGLYACACALFLYFSPLPPEATIGTALARVVVAAQLPRESLIPLGANGQLVPASRFLAVQDKEPSLKRAADWLVWWVPGGAAFAAVGCIVLYLRAGKTEMILRGTVVRR